MKAISLTPTKAIALFVTAVLLGGILILLLVPTGPTSTPAYPWMPQTRFAIQRSYVAPAETDSMYTLGYESYQVLDSATYNRVLYNESLFTTEKELCLKISFLYGWYDASIGNPKRITPPNSGWI